MFWNSGVLLLGSGEEEGQTRPAPGLPIVVDKSVPTVEPVVVAPTVEPVELTPGLTPTPKPARIEVVAEDESPPSEARADVRSTPEPGWCEVYCQAVEYCEELERYNPECDVIWPEE
jgi:hypothetical protein